MSPEDPNRRLNEVVAELRRLPDVLAVVVTRRDGVLIASNLPRRASPKKVGAMVAAIVGTSEMAVDELGQGGFEEVLVESREGRVLGIGAGEEAILVTLVRRDANVGLIMLGLKKAAARIREVLSESQSRGKQLVTAGGAE